MPELYDKMQTPLSTNEIRSEIVKISLKLASEKLGWKEYEELWDRREELWIELQLAGIRFSEN